MIYNHTLLGCSGYIHLGETAVIEAVIFNTHKGKLINETTRAFLRHAVGQWYADITKTALEGAIFSWQRAYLGALKRLRTAALRWAHTIRRHYVSRKYSKLTEQVTEDNRKRFDMIIMVGPQGHNSITPALAKEIQWAEQNVERWQSKTRRLQG